MAEVIVRPNRHDTVGLAAPFTRVGAVQPHDSTAEGLLHLVGCRAPRLRVDRRLALPPVAVAPCRMMAETVVTKDTASDAREGTR